MEAAEVARRQARSREVPGNPENTMKLQAAEAKMQELKANMAVLGKEAAAAMAAVESQQQRLTLHRLIAMVEIENTYHQRVAQILDEVQAEMVSERQRIESAPPTVAANYIPPPTYEEFKVNGSRASRASSFDRSLEKAMYFLAEAMHAFEAESDGELSLAVGDYVVVRQLARLAPILPIGCRVKLVRLATTLLEFNSFRWHRIRCGILQVGADLLVLNYLDDAKCRN
eukprot:Gb_05415 [translate_table: standard]